MRSLRDPVIADLDISLTGRFLGEAGQRAGFLALGGFLVAFLFIRTSARLTRSVSWWPGGVETESGLHIHHLVWGIVTIMVAGFLEFAIQPASPWRDILAVLFGIGCGLTLDEFALWLHLEDVYWAEAGRSSVDAVVVATIIGGLVLAGAAPFDTGEGGGIAAVALAVAVNLALCALAVAKGKLFSAVVGAFLPPAGIAAALRLARPGSPWAQRRYVAGSGKLERARRRDRRVVAFQDRAFDLIGGRPG